MNRIQIVAGVAAVLVIGVAAAWQYLGSTEPTPSPVITEEPEPQPQPQPAAAAVSPSLTVEAVSVAAAKQQPETSFSLSAGDSISSWNFRGAYTDNPELTAKAQSEISRLIGLLVTATSSEMILSVGVANQYELLGDGKNQYDYLGRAIQADPGNGLPWHNLGVLMERLGAMNTARVAHERSTLLNPQLAVYHFAYIEFLIQNMKSDTAAIEKAFAAAEENVGPKPYLAELRGQWQNS